MLKKQFLIICITLISYNCYSQHSDLYLIKLKSGLKIKGELVKIVPDSFIVFKQYGLITKLNIAEVVDITFSETNQNISYKKGKLIKYKRNLPDTGWRLGLQIGFLGGLADKWGWGPTPTTNFVLRMAVLKKVAKKTQVGAMVGFNPYALYSFVALPIEAHIRQYLQNKPKSMFFYGNLGYGFNISEGSPIKNGGITYGYGIGRSYRTQRQNIFSMKFGFTAQNAIGYINNFGWRGNFEPIQANLNIRRFEFRAEVLF